MSLGNTIKVSVNLERIRKNAETILGQTGVPIIAVVKADAYGLGAAAVAESIADLVSAFYVFDAAEAVQADLHGRTNRRTIALNCDWTDPNDYLQHHIHPVVWSVENARQLRQTRPVLSIDTGQQRFSCPPADASDVFTAAGISEVMTHAIALPQVEQFLKVTSGLKHDELYLHAAGSALLGEPRARLSAVRPGLALYRGAVRVSARLVEVRDSDGPAGYTGFVAERFGVILAGYSQGLRRGPCRVNGQIRRVIEVGMQSAFIELGPGDRVGDEVLLLADEPGIDEPSIAKTWGASQQEVLVRLTKLGIREYVSTTPRGIA